ELALVTIEEWSEKACTSGSKDGVVVTAALQLMKCFVTRDIEALASATITLGSKHSDIFDQGDKQWCSMQTESVSRFLLYGVLKALHATARAITATGKIDFGGSQGTNTMPDRVIKEEMKDDETMENGKSPPLFTAPLEDSVKLEAEIEEEEPLCPPLIDTIKIRTSFTAAPSGSNSTSKSAPSIRFRKATKREYAYAMNTAPSTSKAAKSNPSEVDSNDSRGLISPVNDCAPLVKRHTWMYHCKECGVAFRDFRKYESHNHSLPTFPCEECDWTFGNRTDRD
ncbi:hypothetical protein PFISCL1PPCAC_22534, partial [Pristionchus fissidentatus]